MSFELINPDGSPGFQVDAGIRLFGYGTRIPAKKAFRALFKGIYGPTKLDFPMFEDHSVDSFDTLMIRSGDDNWLWSYISHRAKYIADQWHRDTEEAMGRQQPEGSYIHLYLNGLYWGVYNLFERPDASFMAQHYGGVKEDYDAINARGGVLDAVDGDTAAFLTAQTMASAGLSNLQDYLDFQDYVDVDDLIDFFLINWYSGNEDWAGDGNKNWRAARKREAGAQFKFFNWDADTSFAANWKNTSVSFNAVNRTSNHSNNPTRYFFGALSNDEFKILLADHIHQRYFNDGALTPGEVEPRWDARMDELDRAILAESARWGDTVSGTPFDRDDWLAYRTGLLQDWFDQRTAIVIGQLEAQGYYPALDAAEFNQHGGLINTGFGLTMSAPAGTIYYTLDGVTDPRDVGGAINAGALTYTPPSVTLNTTTVVKARVWSGSEWSALTEATFLVNPADAANLAISEINYHPYDALAAFGETSVNSNDYEFVELVNKSGQPISLLGVQFTEGISYTFGDVILTPGGRILVVKDQTFFEERYGMGLNVAGQFASGGLSNGGERLRIEDALGSMIQDFTYNDSGKWSGRADGKGATLEVVSTGGDYNSPENWQSSNEFLGTPAAAGTGPVFDVIINEVLSHSDGADPDKIELYNTTGSTVNLNGWHLTDTHTNFFLHTFGPSDTIAAGAYLTLTEGIDFSFALDGQFGDDIWLVQGNPGNADKPVRFADHHDLDATETDVSLGRVPNIDPNAQGASLFPQTSQSFGSANSPYVVGDVIISEVHYHQSVTGNPDIADNELEFVELYNTTGATVDISEWELRQNDGGDFEMPAGAQIAPSQTVVLVNFDPVTETAKATAFRSVHGIGGGVVLLGDENLNFGNLNNAGEELKLLAPEDPGNPASGFLLVDRVAYDDAAPWPTDADGAGDSLTRTIATNFANFAASWVATNPTPGSTLFPFPIAGDMNGDGLVNLGDVAPIVQALINRSAFDAAHPTVNADTIGDVDGSGTFDLGDLAAFSNLFVGPSSGSASASASASASSSSNAAASAISFATLDSNPAVNGTTMSDATVGLDINVNDLEALHVADAVFAETSSAELLLAGGRPTIDDKLDLTDQTERSDPTSDDEGTTWDDALLDALEEMLL